MITRTNDDLKIESSPIYDVLEDNSLRGFAFQGGTRSGKTYNILIWLITYCLNNTGKKISIVRGTLPSLKASVLRDLVDILNDMELYSDAIHHKTDQIIYLNGNELEYFSVDDDIKVRGRKRDILFVNEANEIEHDKFKQLIFRTSERIIIDWNPSDTEGWVYEFAEREDVYYHISTYKDNPFLLDSLIHEIELLKQTDPTFWQVYGKGQRAQIKGQIFSNWSVSDTHPETGLIDSIYGIDFGFSSSQTAIVRVDIHEENNLFITELLYETGLTNSDLIKRMRDLIPKTSIVYADSASADRIEEIYRNGWNIQNSIKDVTFGIDVVRRFRLYLNSDGRNLEREFRRYKFQQDRNGKILDQPVKFDDHLIDATRYAIASHWKQSGATVFGGESIYDKLVNKKHSNKKNTSSRKKNRFFP